MNPKSLRRSRERSQPAEAPYALNKKAFDTVIIYWRRMDRPLLKPSGAVNPETAGNRGASYKNPVKPLPLEFWADVLLAIKASIPKKVSLKEFFMAYMLYDSDIETERNTHAYRILGGRCHSVEQRLGTEFVRRGLFPLSSYLKPPRVSPGRTV